VRWRAFRDRPAIKPSIVRAFLSVVLVCGAVCPLAAQDEEPPRIGPIVADVRGTFPKFTKDALISNSRGLASNELPGVGFGVDVGVHFYAFKWKAVTVGLGGQLTLARAHNTPPAALGLRPVIERFTTVAPQLSLNFGTGDGWSYLSGGIGPSWWSIVPDGAAQLPSDADRLRAVNYGGGARWFAKHHVAFTFDVRFYQLDPGFAHGDFPASPRTTFLVMGAGVSVK
jgi:hypothetical protein